MKIMSWLLWQSISSCWAGFSKNTYFNLFGSYVNSAAFELYWQGFQSPAERITLESRRRDGSAMDGGYKHGDIKFTIPAQLRYPKAVEVDQNLLDALTKAREAGLSVIGKNIRRRTSVAHGRDDADFLLSRPMYRFSC